MSNDLAKANFEGKKSTQTDPDRVTSSFEENIAWFDGRVPFWHSDLKELRKQVPKEWVRTTLILCICILAILSLFWGAFTHVEQNLGSLVVWVVDFDGQIAPYQDETPFVGPLIVQAAEKIAHSTNPHVGFGSVPASTFQNDPMNVREAIYNFDARAAIIINANATSLLGEAVEQGNSSFDPTGIAQVIYVEARDQVALDSYVFPEINEFKTEVMASVGAAWTKMVMQNSSISCTNIEAAPLALSPAIDFTTFNLRPFGPPTVTPAVSVGLIYLIIVAFFSFAFFMPTHAFCE